jgi:hypothetical protein
MGTMLSRRVRVLRSIMISSGDSGSGYTPPQCDPNNPGRAGLQITSGTLIGTEDAQALECCEIAQEEGAKGWTWYPPSEEVVDYTNFKFDNSIFNCEISELVNIFHVRDVYVLNGAVGTSGGKVQVHCTNGTFADTFMYGSPALPCAQICRHTHLTFCMCRYVCMCVNGVAWLVSQGFQRPVCRPWRGAAAQRDRLHSRWHQQAPAVLWPGHLHPGLQLPAGD